MIERSRPDGLHSETLGQTQTKQKKKWFDTGDVLARGGVGWGLGGVCVCVLGDVCLWLGDQESRREN